MEAAEGMDSWFFTLIDGKLNVVVAGKSRGEVKGIKNSKVVGFVKVLVALNMVLRLCLKKFDPSGSEICKQTMKSGRTPVSRSLFLQLWKKYVTKSDDDEDVPTSDEADSDESGDISVGNPCSLTKEADVNTKKSATGLHDSILKEKFFGTFDVHVNNLVAPSAPFTTRLLDHSHVAELTQSMEKDNCGQLVNLVGMVEVNCKPEQLHKSGTGQVEVLGGNHTREALQALYQKGSLTDSTVKVNIYKQLPRATALMLGYQHNILLHERRKPVSFLDKVRLMRECRPCVKMDRSQIKQWKGMLCSIFRFSDKRKFQQQFAHHLLMADLCDETWGKVVLSGGKFFITEKFFRELMKISGEDHIDACLQTLLTEGIAAFKKQVKNTIDSGYVRKKNKKKKEEETDHLFVCEESGEGTDQLEMDQLNDESACSLETEQVPDEEIEEMKKQYEKLKEDYSVLLKENSQLKAELLKLKSQQKVEKGKEGKAGSSLDSGASQERRGQKRRLNDSLSVGDAVSAKWLHKDGQEEWLDATVKGILANGKVKVLFHVDRTTFTLRSDWIKPIIQK